MVAKVIHWGCIEVAVSLTWENWSVGKEYTKLLNVKNLGSKAKKIKFRIPTTRHFVTLYPKPILLSPGTTFQLPVTFKPMEAIKYMDWLEFYSKEEGFFPFRVSLNGELPKHRLHCPEALNINICAVGEAVTLPFEITNKSNMKTSFSWMVESPFDITPSSGIVDAKSTSKFELKFTPTEARTYSMEAFLVYGSKNVPEEESDANISKEMCKLSGIGKFPHLVVRYEGLTILKDDKIDFGQINYGRKMQKVFQVVNMSSASTRFRIRRRNPNVRNVDKAFRLSIKEGVLPALGFIDMEATFEPSCPSSRFEDHYIVEPSCMTSRASINLTGSCSAPLVTIQPEILEFGCIKVDSSSPVLRTFTITNHSPFSDALFEIVSDNEISIFKFSLTNGSLKPGEARQLSISFYPLHPINYYRRVTILIAHHEPIMLDLIGTAFSIDNRPPALKSEHIRRYRTAVDRGLAGYFPEQLQTWLSEGRVTLDESNSLDVADPSSLPGYSPPNVALADISPKEEYFDDGHHSDVVANSPFVSFDIDWIHLSHSNNNLSKTQTIHLTNHTTGKVIAQFATENDTSKCHFVIEPTRLEVPAGRSTSFTVRLAEDSLKSLTTAGTFLSSTIECYCYHSVQRDHTLVSQSLVFPPWCLLLNVTASTYPNGAERSVPVSLTFNPLDTLFFPSLVIGETTYRNISLSNKLDLPSLISIEKPADECFEIKPRVGVVKPGSHMLVTVRFRPRDSQLLQYPLKIEVNEAQKNSRDIVLVGSAEPPEIIFDDGDLAFIAPTCINDQSKLYYTIRNASRQRIEYQWHVPVKYKDALSIRPPIGTLDIRGFQKCMFVYTPKSEFRQMMKVRLSTRVIPSSVIDPDSLPTRDYYVRLVAEGCIGQLVARETLHHYGALRVGRSQRVKDFVVTNTSDCPLNIRLVYQQRIEPIDEDEQILESGHSGRSVLTMDPNEFKVNPHCEQQVVVHVRPRQRCRYLFHVAYVLLDLNGEPLLPIGSEKSLPPEKPIANLIAEGIYPQVFVADIQASGSARLLTKKHLWQLMSLDDLNVTFSSDPQEGELSKSRRNFLRHSARRRLETISSENDFLDKSNYRSMIQWDLGAMPLNTDPWIVHITLQNPGPLDAEWQFLFPTDLLVDIQPWAENLDFSEEELHEMMIVDNKLFDITPKQGVLKANGDQQMVTIKFRHQFVGVSRLPVLFKVTDGREVLLTLSGASVADNTRYLYLPKTRFCLAPVALGDVSPPIQPLELFNGGKLPINFQFDLTAVSNLIDASFGHPIFTCLTPTGSIPPGRVFNALFKFSPLEARTYSVDLPLRVDHGDMNMLTLVGLGYDRRELGDSAPDFPEPGLANPPPTQAIALPHQPARLSFDRLQLGNVPLFVRVSRAILLHNLRLDSDLAYEWRVTDSKFVNTVDVEPAAGVLQPGQTSVCQVTFTARPPAAFHEVGLVCLLSPHADVNAYQRKLAAWEAEREAQLLNLGLDNGRKTATPRPEMVELTPEQAMDVALKPRFGRLCEAIRSNSIKQGKDEPRLDPRGSAPETSFHTVTIPPLLHGENEDLYFAEKFLERATAGGKLYPKPFPPDQTVLHLAVTARTHDPAEYTKAFGVENRKKFVVDLTLVENYRAGEENQEEEQTSALVQANENGKIDCRESEIAVVTDTLKYLLMSTLKEADMKEVFKAAVDEPIPSYIEMLGLPSAERTLSSGAILQSPPLTSAMSSRGGKRKQNEAPETAVILDGYISSILGSVMDEAVGKRFDVTQRSRLKAALDQTVPVQMTPGENSN